MVCDEKDISDKCNQNSPKTQILCRRIAVYLYLCPDKRPWAEPPQASPAAENHEMMTNPHFAHTLLDWYATHGRTLPWRGTRNPYAIWLSEIILQQTRIEQGRPYWERFMARWPRVEDLAAASEDEVLRLWQGLGYYSRARNLHTAARQIVEQGHFPATFADIKQLKGVGDYTAAAIASIAFDEPVAVVDGNVYRVLARYFGISTPINSTRGKHEFQALAQQLLPRKQAAAFNQAMMDFGAMQCTPHAPQCMACPLMESCIAFRDHQTDELPVKEKKTAVKTRRLIYIYLRCNGYTAIRKRPPGDIWQGLWEPPTPDALPGTLSSPTDWGLPVCKHMKHVLTHRILLADFYLLQTSHRPPLRGDYVWIKESDISHYGIPRLIERMLERLPEA